MSDPALVAPLPPDGEALRADLVARDLPPVWGLEPETARRLHREGNDATRAAWQPPLDTLAVSAEDLVLPDAPDGVGMRAYRPAGPSVPGRRR